MIKEKVPNGKTEDVEMYDRYVKQKIGEAKNFDFSGLDQWLDKVPGGFDLIPQLQAFQSVVQKREGKRRAF